MKRLLTTLGEIVSILFVFLLLPVIILVLMFAGLVYLFETPKRKREKKELSGLIVSKLLKQDIKAYLWYDRNGPLTEYIEKEFIPDHKKHLIYEYGEAEGVEVAEEYKRVVELMRSYSEYTPAKERSDVRDDEDAPLAAYLYTFTKDGSKVLKWHSVYEDEKHKTNVDLTKQMFERVMKEEFPTE